MKIIVTKTTLEILSKQAAEGVEYAVEKINQYNSMQYEEKEDYFVFYEDEEQGK